MAGVRLNKGIKMKILANNVMFPLHKNIEDHIKVVEAKKLNKITRMTIKNI
jgi:hypothetical protein